MLGKTGVFVVLLAGSAAPAAADMVEDCFNDSDMQLKIEGCTAMIQDGRWTGTDLAAIHINRCWAYGSSGQAELALADCDQAVSLAPESPQAIALRGNVYGDLGQHERAIQDFDEAIRLDPGYILAYLNRANAHANLDRHEQAIADFDQLLALDGVTEEQAAEIRARRAVALNWFAWELYRSGQAAEGLPRVEEALAVRPNDIGIIDTRASILCALERPEDARGGFAQVIEVGGGDWARQYQQTLTDLGYNPGPVDGLWGPTSQGALDQWVEGGCPPAAEEPVAEEAAAE